MIDVPVVNLASLLPSDTAPYLILLGIGFAIGGYGSAARFPWVALFGIITIIVAAALAVGSGFLAAH